MIAALSPLDGRYAEKTQDLAKFLSEQGFIAYRMHVELRWLLHLLAWQDKGLLPLNVSISYEQKNQLATLAEYVLGERSFAQRAKVLERQTNHDVKAIEYTLAEHLRALGFGESLLSLIHFACTSEDMNNLAYALMLRAALEQSLAPRFKVLLAKLKSDALRYQKLSMISRTHGQKATPTTLGKEFAVFAYRLQKYADGVFTTPLSGKINGATGNYNAHHIVFPNTPWEELARDFVTTQLGLTFNPLTTQIEPHDTIVEMLMKLAHLATIAIDLCRDFWGYIALGYLKQRIKSQEVGSSTMPHKVNPIDFENAEGNFGLASALAQHMATKLPISRFQRDLSDSTVLRSLGSVLGYFHVAVQALQQGLNKVEADDEAIARDLDEAWELLGEALQTALRASGVSDAYERIKKLTRGRALGHREYLRLVDEASEINADLKSRLRNLRPRDYVGLAPDLVRAHMTDL